MLNQLGAAFLGFVLVAAPAAAAPAGGGAKPTLWPPANITKLCSQFAPGNVTEPRPMALYVQRIPGTKNANVFTCFVAPKGSRAGVRVNHTLINAVGQPWSAGGTNRCVHASEAKSATCAGTSFIHDSGSLFLNLDITNAKYGDNALVHIQWRECLPSAPWSPDCPATRHQQTYLLPPQEIPAAGAAAP